MNKSIARIVIAALILLGIVILANEVNAALSCNVTDSCDFTTVFHMSNVTDAHAELKNNTDYDYKVCCWDTANRTIGTGCGYSSTNLLHLSDQTDAHAELANESDYNSNVCLNTTVGNITFAYSDVCTGYDTCLATVSTNITGKSTDLHVADCTTDPYATKVCVSLAQKGTISTDTSATPFYTTSANPQPPENASCLLDMKRGDKCNVTWAVVATGPIHSIWEFFATFTSLNYSGYVATQQSNNVNVTIAGDATPTINIPTISPSPAYTNNSLDCSWTVTDPDTASVTANITWYKNRTMNRTESVSCTAGSVCNTTDDITSNLTSKGNVWNCTVFAYDGNSSSTNNSVAITITNSIPTVANVTINSTDNLNRTNGTLTGSFGFSDADSIDSLQNNQTRWYNNSVEVAALNNLTIVGSGNLSEGQSWVLSVRVYDGEDWSSWVNSTSLTIANTAPNASNVVLNSTDNLNRTNGTLQGFWTFSDSDGDVQQDNETRWYNNSIEIPALVNLTTVGAGNTTKGENWVFSARVYDGEDWSEWINSSILKINNTLPTHTIPILNSSTGGNYTNESLTCYNQSVSDIDNDTVTLYYKWYNNNTLISSATKNTLGYNNFSKNDNITCEITPGDGEANGTALNSTKLIILNYQPVFNNTITNITWNENTNLINNLTLNNYFYDIDNDNLTYNVTGNSSIRVLINQTTSNVTFRPTTNWDGTEYIIFTATDGGYDTSSNNITLTVNHIEVCGDSICDGSETCTTCLTDCGSCGGGGEGEGEGPGEGEGEGPGEGEGEGPGEGEGEGPAAAPSSVSYSGGITQNILPCSNVTYTETEELPTITETKLDAKIPQGYSTVLEPFNLDCSGESVELTFSIPDDYIDVQLLKCKNQLCAPTIVHEITKLECGEIVKEVRRETRYLTPELMAIGITETNISISEFKKALRSGNNSVKFYGEIFENLTASLSMPSKEIEEAKNPALKITGTPLVLRLNNKVDLTTTITIPYIDENIFEKDSVAMYAKTEEGWDYLGGEIDEENRLVTANITNISTYLNKNNEATFALMGILCTYCVNSSLELIYEPKEKSRDAIILVHGLASSPVTYQQIIDDVRLTNQPFHLLTFGYPGSKSIKEAADEFSSLIEAKSAEFDNIYIVAHSLGGLITQQALYRSYNQSYSYIPKVRKVILVGVPNEGSPVIEVYKEVFGELINREDAQFSLFNLNGRMLDDVAKGIITPRVPTINYYVIAGTRNYALNLLFFKTSTERLFATYNVSDGIVSLKSAQNIGGSYVDNKCDNYWELNVTHTNLIEDPTARKLVEKIIAEEILGKGLDIAVMGSNKYFKLKIDGCSKEDNYLVIGKKIEREEVYDPTECSCGNGVCGQGENQYNCPSDCAIFLEEEKSPIWLMLLIIVLVMLTVLLAYYGYSKYKKAKLRISAPKISKPPLSSRIPTLKQPKLLSRIERLENEIEKIDKEILAIKEKRYELPTSSIKKVKRPLIKHLISKEILKLYHESAALGREIERIKHEKEKKPISEESLKKELSYIDKEIKDTAEGRYKQILKPTLRKKAASKERKSIEILKLDQKISEISRRLGELKQKPWIKPVNIDLINKELGHIDEELKDLKIPSQIIEVKRRLIERPAIRSKRFVDLNKELYTVDKQLDELNQRPEEKPLDKEALEEQARVLQKQSELVRSLLKRNKR